MKYFLVILILMASVFSARAVGNAKVPAVYVDPAGTMRWSGTGGEASFFGVNYTVPFAHAYRALQYEDIDHREAIDRDVYHFARLGFNAYRIHIWDVEISDGAGNLIENEHLELLDYLIARLRERDIMVLITAMTNFGNGYPEKNRNTGAFSYLYDKCAVHSDKAAISAQENYITQLLRHTNSYTGDSYASDPYIIGVEINNEPCHSVSREQTEDYINRMYRAVRSAGWAKPVFYNASHNLWLAEAYFNTSIDGATYQWYPAGLVAGHMLRGNFLPHVDNYDIPFSDIEGFDGKAKIIYEYDPADMLYSYIHPAMVRSLRTAGFQWITQFAYDPIDIAWANTEYQTHFLNLAYTPAKAISMLIAGEVSREIPRYEQFGQFPADTVFGAFRVSYREDLSEMNTPKKFYYTNSTTSKPVKANSLESVAGHGKSPVVQYEGTGAYFLDKLSEGVWRLELMPDVVLTRDPFEKPSLDKRIGEIAWNVWPMRVSLPDLGDGFSVRAVNKDNNRAIAQSSGTTFEAFPGVYILERTGVKNKKIWTADRRWQNITVGEFVAPPHSASTFNVVHTASPFIERGKPLTIEALIVGPSMPDSVIIYNDRISFWADSNPYVKMERTEGYTYRGVVPESMITDGEFRYNIVVAGGGSPITFPGAHKNTPLGWDYFHSDYWTSTVVAPSAPVEIGGITDSYSGIETYSDHSGSYVVSRLSDHKTASARGLTYNFICAGEGVRYYWGKYIRDMVAPRSVALGSADYLCIDLDASSGIQSLKAGFVTGDGFTYTASFDTEPGRRVFRIALGDLSQDETMLLPISFPEFLPRSLRPDTALPFDIRDIETFTFSTAHDVTERDAVTLYGVWIE